MGIIGAYVLALYLTSPCTITIGRFGEFDFPAGWYLYVGSARGPGGLQARLARHRRRLTKDKRARWHIDYLRDYAEWGGTWTRASDRRLECAWAAKLRRLPESAIPVPGFGASDCTCPAHLLFVPRLPGDGWFRSVLGAERTVVEKVELDELLEMLTGGDDETRERSALALARFGAEAVERLSVMLVDGDVDARWWAARALAEMKNHDVVRPLAGALLDKDPDVRACAALALGRLGDGAAAPELVARLADESTFVASVAADALSMIGEPAIPSLTEMLADENPHVRLLAVRALGRIKSSQAVGPLFGMLEDSSYLVRYYAQEALEALGVGMVFVAPG